VFLTFLLLTPGILTTGVLKYIIIIIIIKIIINCGGFFLFRSRTTVDEDIMIHDMLESLD